MNQGSIHFSIQPHNSFKRQLVFLKCSLIMWMLRFVPLQWDNTLIYQSTVRLIGFFPLISLAMTIQEGWKLPLRSFSTCCLWCIIRPSNCSLAHISLHFVCVTLMTGKGVSIIFLTQKYRDFLGLQAVSGCGIFVIQKCDVPITEQEQSFCRIFCDYSFQKCIILQLFFF